MAHKPTKYTYEIRKMLYEQLVEKFGPFDTWQNVTYPEGKKDEYDLFVAKFAEIVTLLSDKETSSDAIKQQIAWATTHQEQIGEYISVWLDNKYNAYSAGFISSNLLPTNAIFKYSDVE